MEKEDLLATLKSVHQNLPDVIWAARGGTVFIENEPVAECLDLGMGLRNPPRCNCIQRAELIAHLRNMLPVIIEYLEREQ